MNTYSLSDVVKSLQGALESEGDRSFNLNPYTEKDFMVLVDVGDSCVVRIIVKVTKHEMEKDWTITN